MNIFTFWEGPMPAYIKMCLETWKHPYILLNYENLHEFTDLPIEPLKRFTLPQIADCVRVHVLRDHGGYWLDADTIMITGHLPEANMVGYPRTRANSIGLLHTEPHSEMFTRWAEYQDAVIRCGEFKAANSSWALMGNMFTDVYVRDHEEVRIHPIEKYWPETYMVDGRLSRFDKYIQFYFKSEYCLADIEPTDLLMLHNSWTPEYYKTLSREDVLDSPCTLSEILREVPA